MMPRTSALGQNLRLRSSPIVFRLDVRCIELDIRYSERSHRSSDVSSSEALKQNAKATLLSQDLVFLHFLDSY